MFLKCDRAIMQSTRALLLLFTIVPCFCQRPFYAGLRPIGYPEISTPSVVVQRLGNDLPAQLNGDVSYANRLDQLPIDQQPFWYINQKQYEDLQKNPKTYPLRPGVFGGNNVLQP